MRRRWGGAYVRTDKRSRQDLQTVSILTHLKGLIAIDCTPESSRILPQCREEAPCIFQQLLTLSSRQLLRDSSKGWLYSSHSIAKCVVYLCAKFGALNPRIYETMSGGNCFPPLPQVQTRRFSIPLIFWLSISNLVTMFPRASGTIMNSSLHVPLYLYASWLRVMEQAQTETQSGKFH